MTTMLVPVGIAYAEASGVPGINGLYATIVPLLAYALFGPSRILVLGPDSALAAVILAVVLPLSAGDPQRARRAGRNDGDRVRRRLRGCRPGASRLHHRAALEADPLRLHERHRADGDPEPDPEAASASPSSADGPLRQAWAIGEKVWAGSTNVTALAIGGGALALILVLKRWPRVPGMLIAVVAATIVVAVFDLAARTGRLRARSVAAGSAGCRAFRWCPSTASVRS